MATYVFLDEKFAKELSLKTEKMPYFLKVFIIFCGSMPFFANAFTVDWSAQARMEAAFLEETPYFAFRSFFKPQVQVIDGLNLFIKTELAHFPSPGNTSFIKSQEEIQNKWVLFFGEPLLSFVSTKKGSFPRNFLKISQAYLTYENEFFKILMGKAPLHFGLGLTYLDREDFFSQWTSEISQMSLYLEFLNYYLKPQLILGSYNSLEDQIKGIVQGGVHLKQMKLEGFYQYALRSKKGQVEVLGEYKESSWDVQLSMSYLMEETDSKNFALAFEGRKSFFGEGDPQWEVKLGYASSDFYFPSNYNVGLLFRNRVFFSSSEESSFLRELFLENPKLKEVFESRKGISLHNEAYFSQQVHLHFLNNQLRVSSQVIGGMSFPEKRKNYEGNVQVLYQVKEDLQFRFQMAGGFENEWIYGVLGQAVVDF